jgi:hypothetical protein
VRFSVVGFMPAVSVTILVLVIVWSGPPSGPPSAHRAAQMVSGFSAGEWALLGIALIAVVLVVQPLQLWLVRLLEGYSDSPLLRSLLARLRDRHVRAMKDLRATADDTTATVDARRNAAASLHVDYPPEESRVLPTRLGNALRASEDRAGAYYGFSTAVVWPHLFLVLPERASGLVEDARNKLDAACRFTVSFAVVTPVLVGVLAPQGWWVALALVPAALACIAYEGAVGSALAYGVTIKVAFDLYRFELVDALHLPLPRDSATERTENEAISQWLGQGVPHGLAYRHPGDPGDET